MNKTRPDDAADSLAHAVGWVGTPATAARPRRQPLARRAETARRHAAGGRRRRAGGNVDRRRLPAAAAPRPRPPASHRPRRPVRLAPASGPAARRLRLPPGLGATATQQRRRLDATWCRIIPRPLEPVPLRPR